MRIINIALVIVHMFSALFVLSGCSRDHQPLTPASEDLLPNPWELEYQKHPDISDHDAQRTQMIAGLPALQRCTDILVTVPDNDPGDIELALVMAVGVDGNWGLWYVDLGSDNLLGEFVVLSADPENMEVLNVRSGETITTRMLEKAATSNYYQLMMCAEALGIEPSADEELGSIWQRIKDKWNELNPCEQMHVMGGIVVCVAVGTLHPVAGATCGVGFWISAATNC